MIAIDFFKEGSGSKQWPPINTRDSPWNGFECLLCHWYKKIRMFGEFPISQDPIKLRDEILLQHLNLMHTIEERQEFWREKYHDQMPDPNH